MSKGLTGILALSESILCKCEVLGKAFEAKIAETRARIHFPLYPAIDESNPGEEFRNALRPPEIGQDWKRGGEKLYWGCPKRYPPGDSSVELLAISVECKENILYECAERMYQSIEKWENSFIDYIILETKQHTNRNENIKRTSCNLELLSDKYISNNRALIINVDIPNPSQYASVECIKEAIEYASTEKELKLEYQMLLSSYRARRIGRNRQAILDACAAIEIVLINQIDLFCQRKNIDSRILLNKYRYLGDRFSLVKRITQDFPEEEYNKRIITPRNNVMHSKEIYPSDTITNRLISCVEKYLSFFHEAYY